MTVTLFSTSLIFPENKDISYYMGVFLQYLHWYMLWTSNELVQFDERTLFSHHKIISWTGRCMHQLSRMHSLDEPES